MKKSPIDGKEIITNTIYLEKCTLKHFEHFIGDEQNIDLINDLNYTLC